MNFDTCPKCGEPKLTFHEQHIGCIPKRQKSALGEILGLGLFLLGGSLVAWILWGVTPW